LLRPLLGSEAEFREKFQEGFCHYRLPNRP
jgi:hypothetical protein